jgi:hypothetical protein
MPSVDTPPLRQCVLAVSVLSDLDVTPDENGVRLAVASSAGRTGPLVEWTAIQNAVGEHEPSGPIARSRVADLLRLHRTAADLGPDALERFRSAARVVALPAGHAEHLGASWVREPLRGKALDLGIGVHGLLGQPERTTAVPASVLAAIGADADEWWPDLREHAERMGALSAARLTRDGDTGLIRPVGGCDVLALLSSRTLRRHLADGDGTGMRALAVPTRRRGWFDVSQVDPAFVRAAWSLTDESDRGLPVPPAGHRRRSDPPPNAVIMQNWAPPTRTRPPCIDKWAPNFA